MEQIYKKKYRLFIQDFQGSWGYEKDLLHYFDDLEDALDYAASLNLKGHLEEWVVDEMEDGYGGIDIVDILCEDYRKFNYANKEGVDNINWVYKHEDRNIPTPGYLFNYLKHYAYRYTIIFDVAELIETKDDNTLVV